MIVHDTIFIDQYIPKIKITKGSRTLIQSPAGSGKTTLAVNDRTHEYSIVLLPTIIIGTNKASPEVPFYFNGKKPDYNVLDSWFGTYDNILQVPIEVLNESIIWIDEVHLLATSSYRSTLPKIFEYLMKHAKTVVGISATINTEVFEDVFSEQWTVEHHQKREVLINNVSCPIGTSSLKFALYETMKHIEAGSKVMVLIQNKSELKTFEETLRQLPQLNHTNSILKFVSEESRLTVYNRSEATKMISNGTLPKETQVVCGTSVLVEGWDLHDKHSRWTVVIAGDSHRQNTLKTPEIAIQLANRTRNRNSVVVHIQRNIAKVSEKRALTDSEIKTKIDFERTLAVETYDTKGEVSPRHLIILDNEKVYSQVPLMELRQKNISTKYAYGRFNPYYYSMYDKHAYSHAITEVIETEFGEFDGEYEALATLEEATIEVFEDNPHYMGVTERCVDDYLNRKENADLPDSIKVFIATCGEFEINARDRIKDLMKLLSAYNSSDLVEALKNEISINQLISRVDVYRSNAIAKYGVKLDLLNRLGTDTEYLEKEIHKTMELIPKKHFHGERNKWLTSSKKSVKTLLGGFVNYHTRRKQVNGEKKVFYILIELSQAEFTIDKKPYNIPYKLSWINEKMRNEIYNDIKVVKNKRGRVETVNSLRKLYSNYVEFFDELFVA